MTYKPDNWESYFGKLVAFVLIPGALCYLLYRDGLSNPVLVIAFCVFAIFMIAETLIQSTSIEGREIVDKPSLLERKRRVSIDNIISVVIIPRAIRASRLLRVVQTDSSTNINITGWSNQTLAEFLVAIRHIKPSITLTEQLQQFVQAKGDADRLNDIGAEMVRKEIPMLIFSGIIVLLVTIFVLYITM